MVVSSNTLFQFTSSLKVVEDIIASKGFWPKYCLEYGWKKLIAVPHCCFCDIPLSAIQSHMKTYGEYGLGMEKEWGIRQNMAPVAYLIKGSTLVKNLRAIFATKRDNNSKEKEMVFITFIKPYKGVYYHRTPEGVETKFKSYSYYNEREWRYVPTILPYTKLVKVYNSKNDFDSNKESAITKKYLCTFEAKDVRYIIVKSNEDRLELVDFINSQKVWDDTSKSILCSRIITNHLINEDI